MSTVGAGKNLDNIESADSANGLHAVQVVIADRAGGAEEVARKVLEAVPNDANTELGGVAPVAVDEEEPTLTFKLLLEAHEWRVDGAEEAGD